MRRQATDANANMTNTLELSDKYFKVDFRKMLQQAIMNMLKTNEKNKVSAKKRKIKTLQHPGCPPYSLN